MFASFSGCLCELQLQVWIVTHCSGCAQIGMAHCAPSTPNVRAATRVSLALCQRIPSFSASAPSVEARKNLRGCPVQGAPLTVVAAKKAIMIMMLLMRNMSPAHKACKFGAGLAFNAAGVAEL